MKINVEMLKGGCESHCDPITRTEHNHSYALFYRDHYLHFSRTLGVASGRCDTQFLVN
jgi:hypothetical protein